MAEAHSAVAFSFTITHEGVNINYDHEVLSLVWQSGIRSWKKRFARFLTGIRNGIYPSTYRSLWLLLGIVSGVQATGRDPSFGVIPRIQIHMPGGDVHAVIPRTMATLLVGFGAWIGLTSVQRYLLKSLLTYKGWMYEARGTSKPPSLKTRLWAVAVKCLEGPSPLLNSYQQCLPKLPLPSVEDTMQRYLLSVRAMVDDEQYSRMEKLAKEFETGIARKLQRYLILKSWWASNYVSDWWEEFVYLRGRSPLMVNSNFYAVDALGVYQTKKQAARAANLIYASFLYRRSIDSQQMKPILIQNLVPLCSWQYERQFNTTRVPGTETDRIEHYEHSEHVVVYHKGRYFRLNTYHKHRLLTPPELQTQLERILDDTSDPESGEEHLAALTAGDRVTWANTRANCFRRGLNRIALDTIERAAFVVVLDDQEFHYNSQDTSKLNHYARSLLHGRGYDRWFDKSFNLIVASNARAGFNAEHSWADAPIMGHYWEFILYHDHFRLKYDNEGDTVGFNECKEHVMSVGATGNGAGVTSARPGLALPYPMRLKWDMTPECVAQIETCRLAAEQVLNDVDLYLLCHDAYGKRLIKKSRVSPDAYLQMALQLAYFRDAGKFSLTYEASMTRLFREGRTETVRPVTLESCAFVRAMVSNKATDEERRQKLAAACARHQRAYQDAMCGKGIDRHLFCLYVVSKYLEVDSPFLREVLSEPWRLSTSQTPCNQTGLLDLNARPECISAGGGFGPVADDGYGVSYLIAGEDNFFFHVSSKKSSPETDSYRFAKHIEKALADMRDLFQPKTTPATVK